MAKNTMESCLYKDTIPNLKATMDYLKEGFDELKSDLKEHIRSEDDQIDRIEQLIIDWQSKADTTYMKKETFYTIIGTVAALASVAGTIYGVLKLIHPTL